MGGLGLGCGSLWAMWHPHAPLANDAASGSLSRKNVLIAGVGNGNGGGEMLLLRIHKELIKNTKSRRSRHDNAKRDGRRYKNEEIYMPNLYLAILKPQSVCLPVCPFICPSLPSVCLWHGRCRRLLLWFLFLMLAMVHYSYQNRRGGWRGNHSSTHSNLSVLCIKCLIIICRFVVVGLFTLRGDARKCAGFSHKAARIDQFGMREREFPLPHRERERVWGGGDKSVAR